MTPRHSPTAGGGFPVRRIAWSALILCMLAGGAIQSAVGAGEAPTNVALYVVPREILFFSAQAGAWTSVRLDAGERVLQRGADGNVAAVVTSYRAIGFSAVLNATHEIRVTEDETLENFKADGDLVTILTRRRAIGFSATKGKWTEVNRSELR
jgi:hypothetical protein